MAVQDEYRDAKLVLRTITQFAGARVRAALAIGGRREIELARCRRAARRRGARPLGRGELFGELSGELSGELFGELFGELVRRAVRRAVRRQCAQSPASQDMKEN